MCKKVGLYSICRLEIKDLSCYKGGLSYISLTKKQKSFVDGLSIQLLLASIGVPRPLPRYFGFATSHKFENLPSRVQFQFLKGASNLVAK